MGGQDEENIILAGAMNGLNATGCTLIMYTINVVVAQVFICYISSVR